ncbi:MAG: phosphoribosylamine--glycine ligase [Bradymonadales bacterium]|nr:MAG: phosphoribosylamine--glycine ligase [Bradymonadales bacterium]
MTSSIQRKYLIIGSGGREHALCLHLKNQGLSVECAPGSDAISQLLPTWSFDTFDDLVSTIREREITEVIVGPEVYLNEGISDFLERHHIRCFGPKRWEARLETDKAWAKKFCKNWKIPTAQYRLVDKTSDLPAVLAEFKPPFVIKASGLAAGKGVWIGEDAEEAGKVAKEFLTEHDHVVVEDFVVGKEVSVFYAVDGDHYCFLGEAQDHKRLLDGNRGPNTGGMGVVSPSGLIDSSLRIKIEKEILEPCLNGLKRESLSYRGFLFLGLMLKDDRFWLLEFNCRLGDPEAQVLLMRLQTSLADVIEFLAIQKNRPLESSLEPQLDHRPSLGVVLASKQYPRKTSNGEDLPGLESIPQSLQVFHSGTAWDSEREIWRTKGGRLVCVCTQQDSMKLCRSTVYPWIESLPFQDRITYRRDIGEDYAGD